MLLKSFPEKLLDKLSSISQNNVPLLLKKYQSQEKHKEVDNLFHITGNYGDGTTKMLDIELDCGL